MSMTTSDEPTMMQKATFHWQNAVAKGKHSYAGTVPKATVAKRRAAKKVAKVSQRANRGTR